MGTGAHEIREAAIDHHHDEAPRFDRWYDAMAGSRFANAFTYGRHMVDVLLDAELAVLPKESRVLDVGCGTGVYLKRIAAQGLVPIGLEPAPAMLERAQRENPGVDVRGGVAHDLPFEDSSMQGVMAIEVFRYLDLEDTRRGLAEMYRVLAPGGFVFVTMVNRYALDGFWILQRARQLAAQRRFDRRHPHCQFFTPAEVQRELEGAGFADVTLEGRMLASLRLAYKLNEGLGSRLARAIEPLDVALHKQRALAPFAGHLVAIARKR